MDTQFVWNDRYNIGVDSIDKEHQRLFRIVNKLFAFKDDAVTNQWACQEAIKFFKDHALNHFANEEAYMASINYEYLEEHRYIHQNFTTVTLPALERELETSQYSPEAIEHFLGVCAGWLIGHTLTEDLAITGKHNLKFTKTMPAEGLDSLEKIIIQILFDMFQLESHLLSNTYTGDRFGNGVYYRLIYKEKKTKRKQEVFLVFEETLLIKTVGKVMGVQTNKLDTLLIHACRYAARQFAERVMKQFLANGIYELETENLLTYEQFYKIFERENPHFSLLFDTGAGYFCYCSTTPHAPEDIDAPPIELTNCLNSVKEYLKQRETSTKPSILIVDDSITTLQYISGLLEADYDIITAESSIAGIRNLTLCRPDLVLLDYEMPVCDGQLMLKMIRSDAAFAKTPVIFLTGRSDSESVKKVMALKPAGYLLKSLPPDKIKESVDAFFQS